MGEVNRRAAQRCFFCDAQGWILERLEAVMQAAGYEAEVSPLMRFLVYKNAGVPLAPHEDYQWLPGYVSAEIPGYGPEGWETTHSFLLYLTDCEKGGETLLLADGQ